MERHTLKPREGTDQSLTATSSFRKLNQLHLYINEIQAGVFDTVEECLSEIVRTVYMPTNRYEEAQKKLALSNTFMTKFGHNKIMIERRIL